jgi:pre-mRNA-splicing factor ISY1
MEFYNIPTTNCTSGAEKFLPDVKELFNNPIEAKKRRSRYEIYKRINASYYGYMYDEDNNLEKLERLMEKEMQAREFREW